MVPTLISRSTEFMPVRPFLSLVALPVLLWFMAVSGSAALAQKPDPGYVGSEICQACHDEVATKFTSSAHQAITRRSGLEQRACESCHGPGAKHAESATPADIRNPAKLSAAEADRTCLGCHKNQPWAGRRIPGGHAQSQVACASCHSVHKSSEELVSRKVSTVNGRCGTCHTGARAQFQRPHAHRLAQDAIKCTDCHNPHGNTLAAATRTVSSNEPGCLKCHGDKRGPFVFEHAPVRMQGCGTCHESHGSANPKMLIRQDVKTLCLECHASVGVAANSVGGVPPAFHDLRSPRFQNCTTCHVKIHGSYVNRTLLR
jgi:DmsE family decaheme c-type cytochrome